jgi:hypothetical protein
MSNTLAYFVLSISDMRSYRIGNFKVFHSGRPPILANIRLASKNLSPANTLAYFVNSDKQGHAEHCEVLLT